MGAGGYTHSPAAYVSTTQQYNGSAWSNYPSLSTTKGGMAGAGTVSTDGGFVAGGIGPAPSLATTEEFSTANTLVITASTLTSS